MQSTDSDAGLRYVPAEADRCLVCRILVSLLFALLASRYVCLWLNTFTGLSLPGTDTIVSTFIFTAFSILHGSTVIGWRRILVFLGISVIVSWSFEEIGVTTGAIYGAYHYGDRLGLRLGAIPVLIPLAWFMMIYASWIVSHVLMQGTEDPSSIRGSVARAVIASAAMTAWDTVMDPGMARSGAWVWEQGGAYFGVPLQNFVGWMVTTLSVYVVTSLVFRVIPGQSPRSPIGLYTGLPVFAYALVAMDHLLRPGLPELRIVAAFGICIIALLAMMRLKWVR